MLANYRHNGVVQIFITSKYVRTWIVAVCKFPKVAVNVKSLKMHIFTFTLLSWLASPFLYVYSMDKNNHILPIVIAKYN